MFTVGGAAATVTADKVDCPTAAAAVAVAQAIPTEHCGRRQKRQEESPPHDTVPVHLLEHRRLCDRLRRLLDRITRHRYQQHTALLAQQFTNYGATTLLAYERRMSTIAVLVESEASAAAPSDDYDFRTAHPWCLVLYRLLCSVNPLANTDTHPIGMHLSIFLQSDRAQKTLNVKHLKTDDEDDTAAAAATDDAADGAAAAATDDDDPERGVPRHDRSNETQAPEVEWTDTTNGWIAMYHHNTANAAAATGGITPPVHAWLLRLLRRREAASSDDHRQQAQAMGSTAAAKLWNLGWHRNTFQIDVLILHGEPKNKVSTLRVQLTEPLYSTSSSSSSSLPPGTTQFHFTTIPANKMLDLLLSLPHLVSVHSPAAHLLDLNVTATTTADVLEVLAAAQQSPLVRRIVFYSNCVAVKTVCDTLTALSNTFKFLYCQLGNHNEPLLISVADQTAALYYFLHATLFLFKNNLRTNHNDHLTTPIATLSGINPRHNVLRFLEHTGPLTAAVREQLETETAAYLAAMSPSIRAQAAADPALEQFLQRRAIELAAAVLPISVTTSAAAAAAAATPVIHHQPDNGRVDGGAEIDDNNNTVDQIPPSPPPTLRETIDNWATPRIDSRQPHQQQQLLQYRRNHLLNDRDFRICGFGSQMGSKGLHDLVVQVTDTTTTPSTSAMDVVVDAEQQPGVVATPATQAMTTTTTITRIAPL